MDVERIMEFILQQQAKAEMRMAKAEVRMEKAEARTEKAEARMDRFDKQLSATRKLVESGIKLVVRIEKAQKRADEKLDRLIDYWTRQRSNGHRN